MDIQRSIDIDNKFDLIMIKNLIKKKINSMKKVAFVFGGSGLIGSEVIRLLLKKNLKVINIDIKKDKMFEILKFFRN